MRRFLTAACLLTIIGSVQACRGPDAAMASSSPKRLAVGDRAPEFRLRDQRGADVTLSDLLKNKAVALVFYRSADW